MVRLHQATDENRHIRVIPQLVYCTHDLVFKPLYVSASQTPVLLVGCFHDPSGVTLDDMRFKSPTSYLQEPINGVLRQRLCWKRSLWIALTVLHNKEILGQLLKQRHPRRAKP